MDPSDRITCSKSVSLTHKHTHAHTHTHMHIHTCMNLMNKEHCSVEITFTFNLKAHMFVVLFILNSEGNSFTIHVHLSKVKPFQLVAF